jgi:hypothetical protein
MLRTSEKLVVAPKAPVNQLADGIDRLREVVWRNDCIAQATEVAAMVDSSIGSLAGPLAASKPLSKPVLKEAAEYENGEWMRDLERGNDETRAKEREMWEKKLCVLQAEHDSRVSERRVILEQDLVQKLEKEHIALKMK